MDLNLFATQLIQTGQKPDKAAALSGGQFFAPDGLGTIKTVTFWETILDNLAQETTEIKAEGENTDTPLTPEKIKKEKVDLALLQLALLGQDPNKNIDEQLADLNIERTSQRLDNRVEQLTKLIDHLTSGLPAAAHEGGNIEELVARLEKRLEKLETRLDAFRTGDFEEEGAPFQLLIATGLNPAQLTKISNRIEEVETKLGRELTVEDLIAGVGNIIPAPGDKDHELSTTDALDLLLNKPITEEEIRTTEHIKKQSVENNDNDSVISVINDDSPLKNISYAGLPTDEIASQLNNIDVGSENTPQETVIQNEIAATAATSVIDTGKQNNILPGALLNRIAAFKIAPAGTQNIPTQSSLPASGEIPATAPTADLPERLSNADFNALFSNGKNGKNEVAKENFAKVLEQHPNLPALNKASDMSVPANWLQQTSALSTQSNGFDFDIQTGMPLNHLSLATHASTSVPQAGQTHPATQMVAAHISKAAQNADTSKMTLQLDPPDLGRVEVQLEFGRERTVKAHLIVEKPETLLMLQRDTASLERALQNAGLDTDSGSLNYEMAGEDYAFHTGKDGHNNGHSGNTNHGDGVEADTDEDIIETTMTWDVNPETGHVHYNIMA